MAPWWLGWLSVLPHDLMVCEFGSGIRLCGVSAEPPSDFPFPSLCPYCSRILSLKNKHKKNAFQEAIFWNHLHPYSIIPWSVFYHTSVNCCQIFHFLLELFSLKQFIFHGYFIMFKPTLCLSITDTVDDDICHLRHSLMTTISIPMSLDQTLQILTRQEDFTILSVLSK